MRELWRSRLVAGRDSSCRVRRRVVNSPSYIEIIEYQYALTALIISDTLKARALLFTTHYFADGIYGGEAHISSYAGGQYTQAFLGRAAIYWLTTMGPGAGDRRSSQ